MTELDAMNLLLRAIGSSPVNTTATNHPDAANALAKLDLIRKRVQKRSWWFNVDYCVEYEPDPITSFITIPAEITKVKFQDRKYVKRGTKLYNKFENTFLHPAALIADSQTRVLDWVDMPESVTEHTAYLSAAEFVRDEVEDPVKEQSFRESAGTAMIDVKKEDLEQGQYNSFQSGRTIRARAGVRPYSRHSKYFFAANPGGVQIP